jgi:hypothetical protein
MRRLELGTGLVPHGEIGSCASRVLAAAEHWSGAMAPKDVREPATAQRVPGFAERLRCGKQPYAARSAASGNPTRLFPCSVPRRRGGRVPVIAAPARPFGGVSTASDRPRGHRDPRVRRVGCHLVVLQRPRHGLARRPVQAGSPLETAPDPCAQPATPRGCSVNRVIACPKCGAPIPLGTSPLSHKCAVLSPRKDGS